VTENALRVRSARVVLADYPLIRRDFFLETLSEEAIDAWLLDRTAYLAQAQALQTTYNTPVDIDLSRSTQALRPRSYGRALVYRAARRAFIDGKGAGSSAPSPGSHGNGLATLGEAIREFMYEKLVRSIFLHSGSSFETVGHYAVIDWGFDVVHENGARDRAGMVLRQAHQRTGDGLSILPSERAGAIEAVLRRYGVTSAGMRYARNVFDAVNLQGTASGEILDFGAFLAVERFERDVVNLLDGSSIFRMGGIAFVQPDAALRVPLELWGTSVSGRLDPKFDNPWIWSHELARDLARGAADRGAVTAHFANLVERVRARWGMGSYLRNLGRLAR
jgi:hypothetical protein